MAVPKSGAAEQTDNGIGAWLASAFTVPILKKSNVTAANDADKKIVQLLQELKALKSGDPGNEKAARQLCQRFLERNGENDEFEDFYSVRGDNDVALTKWFEQEGIPSLLDECGQAQKRLDARHLNLKEEIQHFGMTVAKIQAVIPKFIHEINLREEPKNLDPDTLTEIARVKQIDRIKLRDDIEQFYEQRSKLIKQCHFLVSELFSWEEKLYQKLHETVLSVKAEPLYNSIRQHYFKLSDLPPLPEFKGVAVKGFDLLQEQLDSFGAQLRHQRLEVYPATTPNQKFYQEKYALVKKQFFIFLERRNDAVHHETRETIDQHFHRNILEALGYYHGKAYTELLYLDQAARTGSIEGLKCSQGNPLFKTIDPDLMNFELSKPLKR